MCNQASLSLGGRTAHPPRSPVRSQPQISRQTKVVNFNCYACEYIYIHISTSFNIYCCLLKGWREPIWFIKVFISPRPQTPQRGMGLNSRAVVVFRFSSVASPSRFSWWTENTLFISQQSVHSPVQL